MEIPHPLICAYHDEILFCNSFGLFQKGSSSTYVQISNWITILFLKNNLFDLNVKVILEKGV